MYGLKEIKNIFMLLLMISILMIGCTYKEDTNILKKVKGVGFTYNEYFKIVDELDSRRNGTYFKSLTPDEMITVILDSLKNAVNLIDTNKIPLEVNEKAAYLVTSKDEKGNLDSNNKLYTSIKEESLGEEPKILVF